MERYLKDQFRLLGVPAPQRRAASKEFLATGKGLGSEEVLAAAEALWDQPEREFHYVAADWLRRWVRAVDTTEIDRIGRLITTNAWWDTVDPLAVHVVGPMVAADPSLVAVMNRWIDHPDLWLVRTAIIHQLTYGDDTDVDRLFRYCRLQADHPDFFIRKAIGWSLRQLARTHPDQVAVFVADNEHRLSGLSKREALKHLG